MLLTTTHWQSHFNSQPHKEADERSGEYQCNITDISTHSLTRRLTPAMILLLEKFINFNSQPHKEADGDSIRSQNN